MDEYLGKVYAFDTYENFEDYLIFLGKGYIARKTALTMKSELSLKRNENGSYSLSFTSPFVSTTITFMLGEEFEETKPDGEKVRSVITFEDNKMTHIQIEKNGRISQHVREFHTESMVTVTTAVGLDKIVKRHYKIVN